MEAAGLHETNLGILLGQRLEIFTAISTVGLEVVERLMANTGWVDRLGHQLGHRLFERIRSRTRAPCETSMKPALVS